MVVGMGSPSPSEQHGFCRCREGYIPVMSTPPDDNGEVTGTGGIKNKPRLFNVIKYLFV